MIQNSDHNARQHPYTDFEKTLLRDVVAQALAELEENQDIRISTPRAYVIGYLCRSIKAKLDTERI